ncbi:MAG: hypothetical protein VX715_03915 [Planctomycetota bacterium]|nr:hypothetical protein [Planctomycetota bacterium]
MTTTTPPTPGCLRFPVSAGIFTLLLFLATVPLALVAQDNPFAENKPGDPAPAQQSTLLSDRPEKETNPAVLSILDTNPQTISELARTAEQLINLDRRELARVLLEKAVADGAPKDELADLVIEMGSAYFLRIQRDPGLQPSGTEFARLVREASQERLQDAGRINGFINQLLGDNPPGRAVALDSLKQHGERAAVALAMRLADDSLGDDDLQIRQIIQALVEFDPSADGPLVGMLDSPSEVLRSRLFNVLARRRTTRALVRMVAPAIVLPEESHLGNSARAGLLRVLERMPTQEDAEIFLHKQLDRYLAMDLMIPHDPDGKITIWQWSEPEGPVKVKYSPRVARLILAAQAATDLYAINRGNEEYQLLYLRSILEASKVLNGMDQPLAGLADDYQGPPTAGFIALQTDNDTLLAVYLNSIQTDHFPAAVGALEVLARTNDPRLLESSSGRPSLMVEAVRHSDRRLRFAALQTIVMQDPQQPYPGSSFVLEALAYFAGSYGKPRVLTGDGIASRSQSWAGMLGNLGFDSDRAFSGKDLFRLAARNPDYEFILIGDTISRPGVAETVSLLRKDPRTADIPIGIVVDVNERGVGRRIIAQDDRAHLLINPHNTDSMIIQTRALLEMAGEQPVTIEERVSQAQFALDALSQFATNRQEYGYHDVSRHEQMLIAALFQPQLGRHAAPALGGIATPDAVRALVTFASQETEVLENRSVAVVALDQAFHKHGLLLEKSEVRQIYHLYNASLNVKEDEVVDLLASMLNAIEGPFWRGQAEKDNQEASRRAEQRSAIVELKAQGLQLTLEQKKELLGLLERDFGGQRSSVAGLEAAIAVDQEKVAQFTGRIEALSVGVVLGSTKEHAYLLERNRILEQNQATLTVLTTAEKEHGDKMYKNAAQLRAAIGEQEE